MNHLIDQLLEMQHRLMGLQKTIPSPPLLQQQRLWRSTEFDSATSVHIHQVDTSQVDTPVYMEE